MEIPKLRWSGATVSDGVLGVEVAGDRPKFQGVKHKCADMLARVELARAATWDAARAATDDDGEGDTADARMTERFRDFDVA